MAIIVNGNIIYNIIVFINFEISLFISVIATKLAGNTKKPSNAICSLAIKSQLFSLFNINIININKINVSPIFKIVYIIPTLKRFFNTSGLVYKSMQLKDKLPEMSEEEQLKLLATNGMLVKRPLIVDGDRVLTGFKMAEWETLL